ncbi:hypothetical protein bcgnr5378_66370 [Bacillus cereus]|nr:hypothetical protein bcf_08365 [Bacillus cereus F837/76]
MYFPFVLYGIVPGKGGEYVKMKHLIKKEIRLLSEVKIFEKE